MRILQLFCLLVFWVCVSNSALTQKLKTYYERDDEVSDCSVHLESLKPVIPFDNPFFYNHSWDRTKLLEKAQLSPERILNINQFGCIRLHTSLDLLVLPPIAQPENLNFYASEAISMLRKVFYSNYEYSLIKDELESSLKAKIKEKGFKVQISFPMAEYTIRCMLESTEKNECHIQVELIKYIHKEKISLPGIPEHLDDGYFGNASK